MRISIFVDKAVAVRAGKDRWGRLVVDVPASELSDDERATLAEYGDYDMSDRGYGSRNASSIYPDTDFFLEYEGPLYANGGARPHADLLRPIMTEPTTDVVHAAIAVLTKIRAEREAKEAAEASARKAIEDRAAAIVATLDVGRLAQLYDASTNGLYGAIVDYVGENGEPCHAIQKLIEKNADLLAQVKATYLARKAREEAERRAAEAAEKAARAAEHARYEADRAAWIAAHGSRRLQRMAAEGIECDRVYRDERLAAERPGWVYYQQADGETKEPRNPTEAAFDLLDEARKVQPGAALAYYVIEWEDEDDDNDDDDDEESKYRWTGYVAVAKFLGVTIVYGHPDAK